MVRVDTQRLMADLRERLAQPGEGDLAGMEVDDLAEAIAHPKAAATIEAMFALEATSVQPGEPAPEIELPWLGARPAGQPERFSLAAHRGHRPVALVFGSYT
ncbi:MAG: hypothetical protein JRH16_00275 [Deltaproteobacteria bacterium]|nr:hypothetical protein [Deltaproteobacteria bacterium]MBW2359398.1 hypothetical protein [Deltaproteobacteria bacterium]